MEGSKQKVLLKFSIMRLTCVLEPHDKISLSVLGSLTRSKYPPRKKSGADFYLIASLHFSYRVKYMAMVLVHDDMIITISFHIVSLFSFIANTDVTSSHGRGKTKIYQDIRESRMEPITITLETIDCILISSR